LADPLLLLRDLVQCRHSVPSRQTISWPGLINLFGVYHYDAHSAIVEYAHFIGRASASGKFASLPGWPGRPDQGYGVGVVRVKIVAAPPGRRIIYEEPPREKLIVCEAFGGRLPDGVRITSKCNLGNPPPEEIERLLRQSIEESLQRLRLSRFDLFF